MEVGAQIRKYRVDRNLSQEELADRVYVTRQTVSNWETGKSYPDIHSLLLLGQVFQVSLDQLIKGDVEVMREEIRESEVRKLKQYGAVYTVLLAVMLLTPIPMLTWLGWYALIPWGLIVAVTLCFAFKVEQVKKENDVQTYKEIVAFQEGRRLDEMERQREIGKRPYQKALCAVVCAMIALAVCCVAGMLMGR